MEKVNPEPVAPVDPKVLLVDTIVKTLEIKTPAAKIALGVMLENIVLFDKKNQSYGSGNISEFGEKGVLVRCFDKIRRLKNVLWNNSELTQTVEQIEKIDDNWQDLAIYGIIALMIRRGLWQFKE